MGWGWAAGWGAGPTGGRHRPSLNFSLLARPPLPYHPTRPPQIHPRGVQLQLGTESQPAVVDTLVMSNLGYFQLKAAPGVWNLALTPGERNWSWARGAVARALLFY